jgi:hypothetical protein
MRCRFFGTVAAVILKSATALKYKNNQNIYKD